MPFRRAPPARVVLPPCASPCATPQLVATACLSPSHWLTLPSCARHPPMPPCSSRLKQPSPASPLARGRSPLPLLPPVSPPSSPAGSLNPSGHLPAQSVLAVPPQAVSHRRTRCHRARCPSTSEPPSSFASAENPHHQALPPAPPLPPAPFCWHHLSPSVYLSLRAPHTHGKNPQPAALISIWRVGPWAGPPELVHRGPATQSGIGPPSPPIRGPNPLASDAP